MTTDQGSTSGTNANPSQMARGEVSRLFAAALDGDRRAEAALHLLGAFDDSAHRASFALASAGHDLDEDMPPGVLAGIDRTLAAARNHQRCAM